MYGNDEIRNLNNGRRDRPAQMIIRKLRYLVIQRITHSLFIFIIVSSFSLLFYSPPPLSLSLSLCLSISLSISPSIFIFLVQRVEALRESCSERRRKGLGGKGISVGGKERKKSIYSKWLFRGVVVYIIILYFSLSIIFNSL